jgi:hypothetical protein
MTLEPAMSIHGGTSDIASVYELMSSFKVPVSKWHILAATDGSGSSVEKPIGYGSLIVRRSPYEVTIRRSSRSRS